MAKQIIRRALPVSLPELTEGLHPLLARVYAARQVTSAAELDYSLRGLQPFDRLTGIEAAVELVAGVLLRGGRILVIGDFDADGATSSALVARALGMMGARGVDYLVPNRFEFGYGLTPEIVRVAAEREPDLIITVDNGISSLDGVRVAKALGIRVVVTDHHLPGEELPPADAIVNPNQPGDRFPSKNLAGVGVAFYLMAALRAGLRTRGWFAAQGLEEPNLARLLDLVALGTVADVVPLDHSNRTLVAQGLARIRSGRCCPGIAALLQVAGREPARVTAADLGYVVGPRLNAAGRLQDMSLGIECLLCDDPGRALSIARELDALNRERRDVEADMQSQALDILQRMEFEEQGRLPSGLCLYDASWHQGVIGILASRIKERLHRPVIAFAPAGQGSELKGSARSVSGLHIRDALDAVATRNAGLVTRFGGHAMAAGLSIAHEKLDAFSRAFDDEVCRHLSEEDLQGIILSDGELDPSEMNMAVAEALRGAGPWGQAFPEPLFDGVFQLVSWRIVGERHLKMVLRLPGAGQSYDAIAFNTQDHDWPAGVEAVTLAYRLDVNHYQGRRNVQLIVEHVAPVVS